MKTIQVKEKTIDLSWKNTLVNHAHAINLASEMAKTAFFLGYPLMLWNGRIYSVFSDGNDGFDVEGSDFLEADLS